MYEIDSIVVVGVLGVLAVLVIMLVEVTKALPGLRKVPTKLYAIIISQVVCQSALWVYASYVSISVNWFLCMLAVFSGFVTACIAIASFDTLRNLYDRIKLKNFYEQFKK